jgi:hypothetical protein
METFIKLYRKLLTSSVFDNPTLLKVFIWCLLKATHKEHDQLVGLQTVHLLPGQFVFGRVKDAAELKMHPSSLYRHMRVLESLQNVSIKPNNKFSVVTVANWELYQDKPSAPNNKRTTNEHQMNTNNNVKNDNNNITSEMPVGKSDKRKVFEHDSKPYKCAKYLDKQIRERLPKVNPADERTLQRWADAFDKLNRINKYEWDLISDVLVFSQEDKFWQTNILSGDKFRKQFESLYAKMGG